MCFTFLDTGVGIFKSVKIRRWRRLLDWSNANLMRSILEGKVPSRTGLSYRGKGLPAIYRAQTGARIRRLTIVANDVYASVEDGNFRTLQHGFRGTLLYWETDESAQGRL